MPNFSMPLDDIFILGIGDSHTNGQIEFVSSTSTLQALDTLPLASPVDAVWGSGNAEFPFTPLNTQIGINSGSDPNCALSDTGMSYLSFIPQFLRSMSPFRGKITIANCGLGGASTYTWAGEQANTYIKGLLAPIDGDTITVAGQQYTFKVSAVSANEVTIGDIATSLSNLYNAIHCDGSGFGAGTVANANIFCCVKTSTSLRIAAKLTGTAGNSLVVSTSTTARITVTDQSLVPVSSYTLAGGANVSSTWNTAKSLISPNVPDFIVITTGSNDALRKGYLGYGTSTELSRLISNINTSYPSAKIVFVSPFEQSSTPSVSVIVLPALVSAVSSNSSFCSLVDMYSIGKNGVGNFRIVRSDGLHGSNYGYWIMAQKVAKEINRIGLSSL